MKVQRGQIHEFRSLTRTQRIQLVGACIIDDLVQRAMQYNTNSLLYIQIKPFEISES